MRTTLSVLALALGASGLFAADVNGGAGSPKSIADRLLAESRSVKQTANQMAEQLKRKDADLSKVNEHVASVHQGSENIQKLIAELEASGASFTAKQRESLDTSRKLAEVMDVFVDNKKTMVADGASSEERNALRMQSLGTAKRAELIEKNVLRMGL
jgi:septal ring factor EnvC (AmiA/AmiB activator)